MRNELRQEIDSLINNHAMVLFMKGSKEQPECGFSKKVVEVLKKFSPDFLTINVLSNPELREGIKAYSSWPTIPQLYFKGEFIGGCDIVLDMYKNGELPKLLDVPKASVAPSITLTDAGRSALIAALAEDDQGFIRLNIDMDFSYHLSFDDAKADDFELPFDGITLVIDPYSAVRAHGLKMDFVRDSLEAGFQFENPNEPPVVKELSVLELKDLREQNADFLLIDVRPKNEWQKAHIDFARPFDEMTPKDFAAFDKNKMLVFHCHHGGRSRRMAEQFRARGFTNIYNLAGGIDAWARSIDPSLATY